MFWSPFRLKIGFLILILPLVYSLYLVLMQWVPKTRPWMGGDYITSFERAVRPLKVKISGEEAVGYLGDHSDPSSAIQQRSFQLTQYTLVPAMVTDKRPTKYFVSVLPLDPEALGTITKEDLVLVEDFGNDVRLFKRRGP